MGAECLSGLAKELELAGKAILREEEVEKNKKFIYEHQEPLLSLYEETIEAAKDYINS